MTARERDEYFCSRCDTSGISKTQWYSHHRKRLCQVPPSGAASDFIVARFRPSRLVAHEIVLSVIICRKTAASCAAGTSEPGGLPQSQVLTAETETVLGPMSQAILPGDGPLTNSSLSLSGSTSDTSGSKLDSADSGDNMSLASELDSDHDACSSTWGEVSGTHSQACRLWLWGCKQLAECSQHKLKDNS